MASEWKLVSTLMAELFAYQDGVEEWETMDPMSALEEAKCRTHAAKYVAAVLQRRVQQLVASNLKLKQAIALQEQRFQLIQLTLEQKTSPSRHSTVSSSDQQ